MKATSGSSIPKKIRPTYRGLVTIGIVAFTMAAAFVTSSYHLIRLQKRAQSSAETELQLTARNAAISLRHAIDIETSRLRTLAQDSELILSARSILFLQDATNRIDAHQSESPLNPTLLLVRTSGRVITSAPERRSRSESLNTLLDRPEVFTLLKRKSFSVDEVGPSEMRIVQMSTKNGSRQPHLGVVVPVRGTAGLSGFLFAFMSPEALQKVFQNNSSMPSLLKLGPSEFPSRESTEHSKADRLSAESEVFSENSPSHDPISISVFQSREEAFAGVQKELTNLVLLNAGLALLTGLLAFAVSRIFVRPFKKLSSFVEELSKSPHSHSITDSLGSFSFQEFHLISVTLQNQRTTIDEQLKALSHSVAQLTDSNEGLTRLSLRLRELSACLTFNRYLEVLGKTAQEPYGHDVWIYVRHPDGKNFVLVSSPKNTSTKSRESVPADQLDKVPTSLNSQNWQTLSDKSGQPLLLVGQPESPLKDSSLLESLLSTAAISLENIFLIERIREEERRSMQLENANLEAELMTLKNQMNPHFLFNSLNSIANTIDEDPESSIDAISQLSDLYRKILDASRNVTTPLSEELEIVELYLKMEKTRFTDRLRWAIHDQTHSPGLTVPSLMIQTLVENAVKHGIAKSIKGGEVEILARESAGNLTLVVENTGAAFRQAPRDERVGIGLTNTRKRLQLLYGSRASLEIKTTALPSTSITLTLTGVSK